MHFARASCLVGPVPVRYCVSERRMPKRARTSHPHRSVQSQVSRSWRNRLPELFALDNFFAGSGRIPWLALQTMQERSRQAVNRP